MLNQLFGYDVYAEIASAASDDVIGQLKDKLPNRTWCVIGGGAMILHFGKEVRVISPDLDILLMPTELSNIAGMFGRMTPGTFGHSVTYQGLTVDFLAATKGWERALVQKAVNINDVPVVPEIGLIALKFNAARDKDLEDLLKIFQVKPKLFEEARPLIKQAFANELEDYDSTVMLLKHQAKIR